MTPLRCSVPSPSTYPFGRVKGYSVCRLIPSPRSAWRWLRQTLCPWFASSARSRPDHAFMGDDDLLGGDLVGAGVEVGARPLGRPAVLEVPPGDLLHLGVLRHDRTVPARRVDV